MTNEEMLVTQLIKEGQKCISEGKWQEAEHLFSEADHLDKWKDIYGGQIYSSLAISYAHLGNITKAKHFIGLYEEQFMDYADDDEIAKIQLAE